jgi:Tol biopolymer transport system component
VQPSWSPDGEQLAFANDNGGIFVIGSHGGSRRVVASGFDRGDASPNWSPNGRWIVFTRSGAGSELGSRTAALFRVHPDGTGLRRITAWGIDAGSADWSPDGRRILFAGKGEVPAHGAIHTIRPDGSHRRTLIQVTGLADFHEPRWSPDGDHIVLQGWLNPSQGRTVWTARADGSHLRQLPVGEAGRELESPNWGTAPIVS